MLRRVMEVLTVLSFAVALVTGPATGGQAETKSKYRPASRGITSVGQGQLMLERVTNPYPSFLNPIPSAKSKTPLRIGGVCRDANGKGYSSFDQGFADCLGNSGVFTRDYFGPAQRQAGVGINWK